MIDRVSTSAVDDQLARDGAVVLPERYPTPELAWAAAAGVVDAAAARDPLCERFGPLQVVADYTMPPEGVAQRDFQVLHLDFGVPLGRAARADVVRYTVLHVDAGATASGAATRLVSLPAVGAQRAWPDASLLAHRLRHRENDPDLAEGVLARVVEAADESASLPVKTADGFACGLEFDTVADETRYFLHHGIDLDAIERRVVLQPGQALVFDNLYGVHGRLGVRGTAELHQRCLGFAGLAAADQDLVLTTTLAALTGSA